MHILLEDMKVDAVFKEFADYTSAQDRIALGKKSRKVEAAKRREAMKEMIEDVYVGDEEDEETKEWESEQLRRGGHHAPEPTASKVKQVYKPAPSTPVLFCSYPPGSLCLQYPPFCRCLHFHPSLRAYLSSLRN